MRNLSEHPITLDEMITHGVALLEAAKTLRAIREGAAAPIGNGIPAGAISSSPDYTTMEGIEAAAAREAWEREVQEAREELGQKRSTVPPGERRDKAEPPPLGDVRKTISRIEAALRKAADSLADLLDHRENPEEGRPQEGAAAADDSGQTRARGLGAGDPEQPEGEEMRVNPESLLLEGLAAAERYALRITGKSAVGDMNNAQAVIDVIRFARRRYLDLTREGDG